MMKATLLRALARLALPALLSSTAWAQDAATGEALYAKVFVTGVQSCRSCHGLPTEQPGVMARGADANRIRGAATVQLQMKPLYGVVTDTEYNHIAAYLSKVFQVPATYIAVAAAPSVSVSATSLTFGSQKVGTTGTAQTITVTNAANATLPLALSAIDTSADFTVTSKTCTLGAAVAAGSSCTVSVAFKPVATGARTGTLTLAHNAPSGKTEVALSGQAVDTSPVAAVSPAALTFSSVLSTDSAVMRATLSNTGNAALVLSSLAISGTHAGDFRLASTTTCATSASVAAGSSCVLDVVFKPGNTGARSASVSIGHNAAGGSSAVALNGTGTLTPEPGIALDATEVDMGSQPVAATSTARTVTLTNTGGAALALSSLTVTGLDAGDFVLGGTCTAGSSVASRATCTVTVALRPATLGAKTGTLSIASNAPGSPATLALRGTAVRTPAPLVSLSQAAIGFGTVTFGTTSVARTVVLTNAGSAPMTVSSIESSSTEYPASHDCPKTPATLAVGASCLVSVAYKPTAAISDEAVVVTTNALSSPNSIVLTGEGTSQALSVLSWQGTATSLNFAPTVVGSAAASQTLTLVNKGPGAVTLTTLGTAGASAGSFAIDGKSTCLLGLSIPVNGTCTITVGFVPGSAGSHAASLQVASTGTRPGDITLTGTASTPSTPTGLLSGSAAMLDFSGTVVAPNTTSAAMELTVTNRGTGPAAITGLQLTGPFAIAAGTSGACPAGASTLAIGASCKVTVVFKPVATGSANGSLTVGSATTPVNVQLKGLSLPADAGVLKASVSLLDFTTPPTALNEVSAAKTVTINNGAIAPVSITAPQVTGPFQVTSTCGTTLAVNTGCTLSVVFAPKQAGTSSGLLSVTTAVGQVLEIALSGATPSTGTPGGGSDSTVLVADVKSHGFVGVLGIASEPKIAKFTNMASTALVIQGIDTASPFEVANGATNACRPAMTLAAGASCEVAVAFRAPMSTGTSTGALTVTAKAAGGSATESRTVGLEGMAIVTNAGGRSDDLQSGGGAADPAALLLLALALLALRARRPSRFF